MALRIHLRDGEKVVVNGALLQSVGRTEITVENRATIVRGRELMRPEDATTPAKLLYFACLMAYIDPDRLPQHQDLMLDTLRELVSLLPTVEARSACIEFGRKAALLDFYGALADCRALIELESQALDAFHERAA
jgi:flagellar protein FlbT